ncbi:hypothetical protein, partial [Raoultella planticola]|uniref:hypothetical protein n=1 Tax=Raoultella planticola TaxID=575 RepID=UPI00066BECAC
WAEIFPGGAALTGATGDGHPDKALVRQSGRFPDGRRYSPGGAALTGATGDARPDKALARNPGGFLMGGD